MARRRWIDPSFWDDEDIGDLTFRERLFFIGCWSNADDEGRLRGNPASLRSNVFRYDDLSLEEVTEIRDRVLSQMHRSLFLYEHDGREYLAFDEEHWMRYQNPNHPKESTLPAPPAKGDRGSQEGRKKQDREPQETGQNPSTVGRVGLGRVGKGSSGEPPQPFSQIFTSLTGVLVATATQAEEMDAWMDDVSEDWFRAACKAAVDNNARKWSYVRAILGRCKAEGSAPGGAYKRSHGKRGGISDEEWEQYKPLFKGIDAT
jgi:DnaD/phage-associated family protein